MLGNETFVICEPPGFFLGVAGGGGGFSRKCVYKLNVRSVYEFFMVRSRVVYLHNEIQMVPLLKTFGITYFQLSFSPKNAGGGGP
jgi:hypothetical protein